MIKEGQDSRFIPMTSISNGEVREASLGVYVYTSQIVNVVFVGNQSAWVLVDTGMPKKGDEVIDIAESLFGRGACPSAIILTHGHFDHVGGVVHVLGHWKNVPVYAHPMEFGFLTGRRAYTKPDSSVQGGLLAKLSWIYPVEPIDIESVLLPMPDDGSVPFLPDWRWIHTPGHSPGQIALFRRCDAALISADAFITVRQDSLYRVLMQTKEICGPPVYLTTDWAAAEESVRILNDLGPLTVVPGHGQIMRGSELKSGLARLAANFAKLAVPSHGKFITAPALPADHS
jgi:glyoxylase-like metal-dependent hydrolase (beta-lactamase superfamily II)